MPSKPNTVIERMIPNNARLGQTFKSLDGQRTWTATAGVVVDMSPQDCAYMEGNGWHRVCGRDGVGVGPTSGRPTDPTGLFGGAKYLDTTLGYIVIYDDLAWRNPMTGAVV